MRFKSNPSPEGYVVYAVSGVHSVSFGIDFTGSDTKGLLGFAVERLDPQENERYYMYNSKVFRELVPRPDPEYAHTSFDHPIQSFVWDDFSVKPGYEYEYFFYPVKGKPKNLLRSDKPITIKIKTEAEFDPASEHDVFFNRGVASSQAYARRFKNQKPDEIKDAKLQQEAWEWLGRGLDKALIKFIQQAKKGDGLFACVYEFHYGPVIDEFAKAIKRGVNVRIIYDAKANKENFPRDENKKAIKGKIPIKNTIERKANKSNIQHNKFIVFVRAGIPEDVWLGSTNISKGGIFGQTNVGHWLRNGAIAAKYLEYWRLLEADPGNRDDRSASEGRKSNKEYKTKVAAIESDITAVKPDDLPVGIKCIFSPRPSDAMLITYATLLDNVNDAGCITLAFGINETIKNMLKDDTSRDPITFMLLEKEDKPTDKTKDTFVSLGAKNNVYQAFGAYIDDPLYQFTKEVSTRQLQLNTHVAYIHTKFMLLDPLSQDPGTVTGSANFSEPSVIGNDENMLIIKGDKRVADIYFTEFMRLFTHYYFRSVYDKLQRGKDKDKDRKTDKLSDSIFLLPDDSWLEKYAPGRFRRKRMEMFTKMAGATTL